MDSSERFLTVREAAAAIGVTDGALRSWIRDGRLPAIRFSPRTIRIRKTDLDAMVEAAKSSGTSAI